MLISPCINGVTEDLFRDAELCPNLIVISMTQANVIKAENNLIQEWGVAGK